MAVTKPKSARTDGALVLSIQSCWNASQGEFRDIPPLGHLVVVVTVVTDVGLVCVRIRRISGTKVQARLHGSAAGIKSVTIL